MSEYEITSIILSPQNNISTAPAVLSYNLPTVFYSEEKQISLANLSIYFSWFNVTSSFNNNQVSYIFQGVTTNITIPNGYYSAADLTGYINFIQFGLGQYLVDQNGNNWYGISIVENSVYYADSIVISGLPNSTLPSGWTNPNSLTLDGSNPQIIIPALNTSTFGNLIGFGNATTTYTYPALSTSTGAYPATNSINSTFTPQISPITGIYVVCNLANTGNYNSTPGIIAVINTENVAFGQQITVNPTFPVWYKMNDGRIPLISVSFYSNLGQLLAVNDTDIIVTLNFRTIKKTGGSSNYNY